MLLAHRTLYCLAEEGICLTNNVSQAGLIMVDDGKYHSLIILKDSSWLPGEMSWC
ncbi:hypothetical protein ACRRTK_001545 [Alexandromys fortis]